MRINPESFNDCIARIRKTGKMSKEDAIDLLNRVATHAEQMRITGEQDPFVKAATELANEVKDKAAREQADALNNSMLRQNVMNMVAKHGVRYAADVLRGIAVGGWDKSATRNNIQSFGRWLEERWTSKLGSMLEKGGLTKFVTSGLGDSDIAQEMFQISNKQPPINAGSQAHKAAVILHKILSEIRDRLNAAGAKIGDAMDYVMKTEHDPEQLRAAAGYEGRTWYGVRKVKPQEEAFKAWWAKTMPRLAQKTFDLIERRDGESFEDARDRFARSVYEALLTGVHKTQQGAASTAYFEGTRNLARMLSEGRVLFWKDGKAWAEQMKDFGHSRTLYEGVINQARSAGRYASLMDKLGTNPTDSWQRIIRQIEEDYRGDADGLKAFQKHKDNLQSIMDHLDGAALRPNNEMAARLWAGARGWTSVSSLGGVGPTHAASAIHTAPSALRVYAGASRLATMGRLLGNWVTRIGGHPEELAEVHAQLGATADGIVRNAFHQFALADDVPGRLASLSNTFFRATGIHHIFDTVKATAKEVAANHLARNVGKSFAQLPDLVARTLEKYDLGGDVWEMLRKHGELTDAGGRKYLTPKAAENLDPAVLEAHLRKTGEIKADADQSTVDRAVKDFRYELADRIGTYYSDVASDAVVTAGAKERAFVIGSTKPGTLQGEFWRSAAQFKMWPIASAMQMWSREWHMNTTPMGKLSGLGYILGMSTLGGYLKLISNDIANGRPPRKLDGRVIMASMAQGGGMGIWGDFVFGEHNRLGQGMYPTLAGPLASDVIGGGGALASAFQDFISGDPKKAQHALDHLEADAARGLVKHIPFANLVYLKGALDYMLWYHLYEAISPGWWERTNKRLIKEQGRPMTGYVPGGQIPWTPWAMGAKTMETTDRSVEAASSESGGGAAPHF